MKEIVPINSDQAVECWYFIKNSYVKYNVFFGKTPLLFQRQFKWLSQHQVDDLTSFYKLN